MSIRSMKLVCLLTILLVVNAIDPINLSNCGISKGCVTSPPNCKTRCHMAFTFQTDSSGVATLEIFSKLFNPFPNKPDVLPRSGRANQYIAVGFSEDKTMGDDTVIQCINSEYEVDSTDSSKTVHQIKDIGLSRNPGKYNQYIGALRGFDIEHSYTEQGLLCRMIGENSVFNSFGDPTGEHEYPLGGKKYILLTTGNIADPTKGKALKMHILDRNNDFFPVVSEEKIDILMEFNTAATTPQAQATTTTESGSSTTESHSSTTESENSTNVSENSTTEPEKSTKEPEKSTAQPDNSTTEPEENSTTDPEKSTAEPEKSTNEPENSTAQPENPTTESEPKTSSKRVESGRKKESTIPTQSCLGIVLSVSLVLCANNVLM